MQGKTVLVIGGTRGIGKETAEGLAKLGATVVIVGRNREVGDRALEDIRSKGGNAAFIAADMSLMSEVQRLAETFKTEYRRLDVLIHSADLLHIKREETAEGLEVCFALNYLSRFLLNNLLLDVLKFSAPARIIHIAAAGFPGKLNLDHVPPRPGMSSFKGHNIGQQANDVFAVEFASRLEGTGVTINVMNPGMVATNIRRNMPDGKALMWIMEFLFKHMARTPEQFAQHVIYLATSPTMADVNGGLFGPSGKPIRIRPDISDAHKRGRLWERSEQIIGLPASCLGISKTSGTARSVAEKLGGEG